MGVLKLPFSSNIGNSLGSDFLKIKTPQNPGVADIQQSTAPVINTKLNQGTQGTPKPYTPAPTTTPVVPKIPLQTELNRKKEDLTKTSTAKTFGTTFGGIQSVKPMSVPGSAPISTPGKVKSPQEILAQKYNLQPQFPSTTISEQTEADKARTTTPLIDTDRSFMERLVSTNTPLFGLSPVTRKQYQEAGYQESKFQDLMDTFEQSFMDTFRGTKKAIYGPLAQSAGAAGIISPETLKSSEMKYEDLVAQDAQRKIDQPYKQPRESWNKGIEEAFTDGTYKDPGYRANMVSQVVGQIAATVPAMVVGSAAGGPVGAGLAIGAMMYGPTTNSVYEDLKASGVDSQKAGVVSSVVGIPLAALDFLGERMQLKNIPGVGKIFNKIKKEATEKIVEYTTAQIAKKSAKTLATAQLGEGLTEAAQQIIQNATVKYFDKDRDLLAGVLDSFVVGAVGASPFGMMGMAGKVKELRLHNEAYRNMSEDELKAKVEEIEAKGDVNGLLGHEPEEKFQEKPDTYLYLGEQIPMETKKGAVLIDNIGGLGIAEQRLAKLEGALKDARIPTHKAKLQGQIDLINEGMKEYEGMTKAKFQEKEGEAEPKVTSRFIEDLDKSTSKEMVGREMIVNQTKRQGAYKAPELKYVQDTLAEFEGDKIPKKEFIESLRSKMIELNTKQSSKYAEYNSLRDQQGYEPRDSYSKIYQAPFTTKGAETHFQGESNNYFAHSRVEEVGKRGNTNRVVEIQSDLFQRQRYKNEGAGDIDKALERNTDILSEYTKKLATVDKIEELKNKGMTYEEVMDELSKTDMTRPYGSIDSDMNTQRARQKLEGLSSDYTTEQSTLEYMKANKMDTSAQKLVQSYFRNKEQSDYYDRTMVRLNDFLKRNIDREGEYDDAFRAFLEDAGLPGGIVTFTDVKDMGKKGAIENAIQRSKDHQLYAKTKMDSYLKDIKEAQKITSQEKTQHLEDYANRRHERVVREEIAQAASEGKEYVQLPDPKTIAQIEGYLSEGGALPANLERGEEVDTPLGERGVIRSVEGDSYEVVPADMVTRTTAQEWIQESFDKYIGDVKDSSDQLNYEEAVNFIHDTPEMTKAWKEEYPKYDGIPSQERDVENSQAEEDLAKFVVDHSDAFEEFFKRDRYEFIDGDTELDSKAMQQIESDMEEYGYEPRGILQNGDMMLITEENYQNRMESVGAGAGADNENRYDQISEDQRAVVDFYKNKLLPYAEKLTKGRSEYVEEDGGRWLQIEIKPEDKKAVEAFQAKKTDSTMKTPTTPEQAKQWTENFFKKLVNEGIITTEIKDKIMTPAGLEAYGRYKDALISFAKDPIKSTAPHESFHAAFDLLFTTEEKMDYLEAIKEESGAKNYTEAEEWLADKFAEEADKLMNNKPSSYKGKVAEMFAKLRKGIKALFGNKRDVDTLFSEIMKRKENVDYVRGKRAKEIKKFQTKDEINTQDREKDMMENFKRNDPDRQSFIDRVAKIEAEEQRIGKVAGKKVGAVAKDAQMRLREKRKESLIEEIGSHYSLDANEARDMYDDFVNVPVSQIGVKAKKPDIGKQVRSATAYRAKGNPEGEAKALDEAKRILSEANKEPAKIPDDFYEKNKAVAKKKQGTWHSIAEFVSDALEPISYRLGRISKTIKTRVREFDFREMNGTKNLIDASRSFLDTMKELRKDKEKFHEADLALKNGDMNKLQELGLEVPRDVLDFLHEEAVAQGLDVEYRQNYFPRQVENAKGLLDHLRGTDARGYISDALKARETKMGRELTLEEKAEVANKLLSGFAVDGIRISLNAMKERSIDIITSELNQYYADPVDGFINYIAGMTRAIELKRLFGSDDADKAIGTFVAEMLEKGRLNPAKEEELVKLLKIRFNPATTSKFVSAMRGIISGTTMGSPISAITQIQDLATSMYESGLRRMLKPRQVDMTKDLGIDAISQEFSDQTAIQKGLEKLFTVTGFKAMDRLGKQNMINSYYRKITEQAKAGKPAFKNELMEMFGGDEKRVDRIIQELKDGYLSQDAKFLLFNKVADYQPITQSEMPYSYMKSGNSRLLYVLKSFTLKQIEGLRREGIDNIKDGLRKKWEAKRFVREGKITEEEGKELMMKARGQAIQGGKNLLRLAGLLAVMGMTTDEIKDLIMLRKSSNILALIHGEETNLSGRLMDNLLKLLGASKYAIYQANKAGIGGAIQSMISVPTGVVDQGYRDLRMIITNPNLDEMEKLRAMETIQSVPLVGKLIYRWFGQPTMTSDHYSLTEGLQKKKYTKDIFTGEIHKKKKKKSSFSF